MSRGTTVSRYGWVAVGVLIALGTAGGFLAGLFAFIASGPSDLTAEDPIVLPSAEPITLNGQLTGQLDSGHVRLYEFTLARQGPVTFQLMSDFDNYLELYAAGSDTALAQDDDSGENLNALLSLTLSPGTYTLLVRSYNRRAGGFFTLTTIAPFEPPPRP